MIDHPHFDSYSIPARVCFGVAVGGGISLAVLAFMGIYFAS
jgi:hypothetical protein